MKHLILTALASAAICATGSAATIYGVQASNNPGVYSFDTATPATAQSIYTYAGMTPENSGAVFTEGRVSYVSYDITSSYSKPALKGYTHDGEMANWETLPWVDNLPWTSAHTALTLEPLSGTVYGCFYNADKTTFSFGTLDVQTGAATAIAPLATAFRAMACTDLGVIYAIDDNGNLLLVQKDGSYSSLGYIGVKPRKNKAVGACIDPVSGLMYISIQDSNYEKGFYSVDLSTATATLVASTGDIWYPSLYIVSETPQTAPATVENFTATAEGFSTDLTVSFTMPSATVGGTQILSGLYYHIYIDGVDKETAMTGPGLEVEKSYTLEAGQHSVVVFVTNPAGDMGPKSALSVFLGEDTPGAVGDLEALQDGNTVTLSWTAPATGMSGGSFDASAITYTVKLMPADEVLAEGLTETTYTYVYPETALAKLSFQVLAVGNSGTSSAVSSPSFTLGDAFTVPYSENFDGKTLDETFFTIENANGDAKTWELYNSYGSNWYLKYTYNSAQGADDWAFTPPIALIGGRTYELTFTMTTGNYSPEILEVKMGAGAVSSAMDQVIMQAKEYGKSNKQPDVVNFVPEETGNFNIGFHLISPRDIFNPTLDDISLVEIGGEVAVGSMDEETFIVKGIRGGIYATGKCDVFNAAGQTVAVDAEGIVSLAAGVYIVRNAGKSYKVIVR